MESGGDGTEVAFEIPGFIRVYKDHRVERLSGTEVLPPSVDPATGVSSKDVVVDPVSGVSVRLFLPSLSDQEEERRAKLPILFYVHGGGFIIETPFSPIYHGYLNSVVARARVVGVSVHYGRAPENPLPAAYEDSWAALRWAVSRHADPWLTEHGDLTRLFLDGDSAGANIVHDLAMRAGAEGAGPGGVEIQGIVLTHPFFWGRTPVGKETTDPKGRASVERMWNFACPSSEKGIDDPCINPTVEGAPTLAGLRCGRILVCVAENDFLAERGRHYFEALRRSGWGGESELLESPGEGHVFHLLDPTSENAAAMMQRLVAFIQKGPSINKLYSG